MLTLNANGHGKPRFLWTRIFFLWAILAERTAENGLGGDRPLRRLLEGLPLMLNPSVEQRTYLRLVHRIIELNEVALFGGWEVRAVNSDVTELSADVASDING